MNKKKILTKINNEIDFNPECDGYILGFENFSVCFEKKFSLSEIRLAIKKYIDKEIFVALNRPIFNKEINDYKEALLKLDKLGLKGIIVGDIAALTYGLKTNLILDQMHLNNSYFTINHYYNNNVNGVILTNDITLDEINTIKENSNALLFKQGFGLSHLSTSVRKLTTNYLKFSKIKNADKYYFIKEPNKNDYYYIIEDDFGTHIFDSKVLNLSLYLDDLNVDYIIVDSFLIDKNKMETVYKAFSSFDKKFLVKLENEPNYTEGFINKKTIYKVKNNE